jgi:hypothetical protein
VVWPVAKVWCGFAVPVSPAAGGKKIKIVEYDGKGIIRNSVYDPLTAVSSAGGWSCPLFLKSYIL